MKSESLCRRMRSMTGAVAGVKVTAVPVTGVNVICVMVTR